MWTSVPRSIALTEVVGIPEIAASPIMLTRARYVYRLQRELNTGQKGEKAGAISTSSAWCKYSFESDGDR